MSLSHSPAPRDRCYASHAPARATPAGKAAAVQPTSDIAGIVDADLDQLINQRSGRCKEDGVKFLFKPSVHRQRPNISVSRFDGGDVVPKGVAGVMKQTAGLAPSRGRHGIVRLDQDQHTPIPKLGSTALGESITALG